MTSTAWPVGLCAGKTRNSGEATLATKGAGQAGGNVAGTNVPFGGAAGQSAIRSAAFRARDRPVWRRRGPERNPLCRVPRARVGERGRRRRELGGTARPRAPRRHGCRDLLQGGFAARR